jgi:hypothetical protein
VNPAFPFPREAVGCGRDRALRHSLMHVLATTTVKIA